MNTYVDKIGYIESKVHELSHVCDISSVKEVFDGVYNIQVPTTGNYYNNDLVKIEGVSVEFDSSYRIQIVDKTTIQINATTGLLINDTGTLKREINFRFGTPTQLDRNYKNSPVLSGYYFALFTPLVSRQYSTNSNQQFNSECDLWIAIVQPFNKNDATPFIHEKNVIPCAKVLNEFANICGVDDFPSVEHTYYGVYNKRTKHTETILGANKAGVESSGFRLRIKKGGNDNCEL